MTSRDFCYWLQGYFEIGDAFSVDKVLNTMQTAMIRRHLAMVFVHEIDPSFPKEQQAMLDKAHAVVKEIIDEKDNEKPVPPHSHGYVPPPVFRC